LTVIRRAEKEGETQIRGGAGEAVGLEKGSEMKLEEQEKE